VFFGAGVVVMDHYGASRFGQALSYESTRHFLEYSTGKQIPSEFVYDPNKKTLLGDITN